MLSTQAPTHSARAHRTPTAGQGRHDLPVPGRRADPCGLDVRARLGPDPGSWSWQGLAGRRATRGGGLMFTDPEDFQPEGLTEAGRQLLEVYRVLLADSELGDGGRLVSKISEERLAAKLGVSVPTVKRRIADLREPGPDPRHPNAKPAGRRLSWLKVVPRQHRSGPHKGEFIGNRYVLLLGYEEATAEAARIEGSRPKPQVRAKGHAAEPAKPQVRAKDHEGAAQTCRSEPRITSTSQGSRLSQGSRRSSLFPLVRAKDHRGS